MELDERRFAPRLVEHRRAHVDEILDAFGLGVEPALAVVTVMVPRHPVVTANHGLARNEPECIGSIAFRQREGASRHMLAARAMAGRGEERLAARLEPDLAAAAAPLPSFGH